MTCRFYALCALTSIALHPGCVEPPLITAQPDMTLPSMDRTPLDLAAPDMSRGENMQVALVDDPRCEEELPNGARFHAGEGVSGAPFLVCTPNNLALIAIEELERFQKDDMVGHYILGKDIDLSARAWTPIPCFRGVLDGAGHTIKNLSITSGHMVASCRETESPYHGGFITEVIVGTIRDLHFQGVSLGSPDAPLPELYATTQTLHTMGGLFGVTRAAQIEDLTVQGLDAHVTGRFGGIVNQSIDSAWTRVSIHDSSITYKRGHIGGFVRHANATAPPGPRFKEISVDVKLFQNTSPRSASVELFSPFGLFAATTEGPFTLERATIKGGITHRYTPGESVMMFGGVVGQTIDQRLSDDRSNEAMNLRVLKTSLRDILVEQVSMTGCELDPWPCHEAGAIFGRLGTASDELDITPVELGDVEIASVSLQGTHAALIAGHHVNGALNLLRVSLHGNKISRHAEAPVNLCLISRVPSVLTTTALVVAEGLCLDENTCKEQPVDQMCMSASFTDKPWQSGANPPQLER